MNKSQFEYVTMP